ncbi:hypothetical protein D3C85_1682700 [compost metagenome]
MVRRWRAMSTMHVPVSSAMRMRSEVTAGGVAQPGTVMPSASAIQAIVLAVPMTEQVPTLATSRLLTSAISTLSISPARNLPQ